MKFEPDTAANANAIGRHEPGRIWVGTRLVEHSVLVPWRGAVQDWPVSRFADLRREHFDAVAALQPEVVVFGSGERLRFPPPALTQALMAQRVGIESMDNAAACRTFNVLASEGRRVLLAVLIESAPDASAGGAPQSGARG